MEQRRNAIVELVNREGSLSFVQLKEAFPSVSEMTLRTDLKALDQARRVVRVRQIGRGSRRHGRPVRQAHGAQCVGKADHCGEGGGAAAAEYHGVSGFRQYGNRRGTLCAG